MLSNRLFKSSVRGQSRRVDRAAPVARTGRAAVVVAEWHRNATSGGIALRWRTASARRAAAAEEPPSSRRHKRRVFALTRHAHARRACRYQLSGARA
jgi:hypothetical protein